MSTPAVRCKAISKSSRKQCQNWAIQGGEVCRIHGGGAPAVKAKAAVRAEVMSWGLGDATVDPGEVLLRLVTQSAARVERYASELEAMVTESPSLREALVAEQWAATEDGELYKRGEYIRGLAVLEAQERDRLASFAAKAVAAGLAERTVRVAERQGQLMVEMVQAALREVDLSPEQVSAFKAALARQARELTAPS
jgi:hypothetical protein